MNEMRNRVIDLDINDVLPNRFQPRVKFNEDAIIELAESIKEHGIIQPIIVRPIGDKYEIIAGERRYKASILAGKDTIPAIITDLNDKDSAEIALIENVQRKNLTPIEEAVSYKKILDMGYLTQEQLALKLGRSQSSIANKMRLLHLSDEVQEALVEEKISERHARSLLKLNTPEKQNQMLSRIINERLTVRKTDEEIDKMINESPVEEVNSTINTAAFVNSNPGFVDVNRIENEAKEIPTTNSFDNNTKVDINALLAPDASRAAHVEPPKQEKTTNITSSLFNLFAKNDKQEVVEETKPATEEKTFYSDPFGSFDNKPIQENKIEEGKPIYTFKPLPKLDDYDTVPSQPTIEPAMNIPTDIKPATNNVNNSYINPTIDTTPVAPVTPVTPQPTIEPTPVARPTIETKPADIEVIEPVMPKIDLSKFEDNNSFSINNEPAAPVARPTIEPAPVAPQPTVETKPEPVAPTPIIITDYDKQYDPIIPASVEQRVNKVPFTQILSNIRNTVSDVERAGYPIDTDEIDLGSEYRIIITVKKDN